MIEDEALWQEFAGESDDHLDAIDRILSAGESDRSAVDRLFRAFHSLKGMSDALGAPGMKNVAHRCEDLLGLARNGRLAVTGAVADGLLAAVDTLRRQRATVLGQHRDVPAPADLLARLSALADAGPAPAPRMEAAAPPPHLGAGEALRGALASRFQNAAPLLAGLVGERRAEALREAAELSEAARLLGLARLAGALDRLAAQAGTAAALPALGGLRRGLLLLQEVAGEEAGALALTGPAGGESVALGPRLAALALQLEAALAGGDATAAMATAEEAAEVACAFGLDGLEHLLLALGDLADRAADPDAAALLAAQGPALVERLRHAAEGGLAGLRAVAEALPGGEAMDARIPAAFVTLLGAEGRRRVIAAVEGGRLLVRLRLAIGLPAELEAAITTALAAEAEVLTSRTVLDGQPPHLDMLLAGPAEFEALSRIVTAADPARRAVLDLAPAETGPAPEAAPLRSAPVTMRVRQETIDQIIALETEVRAAALALAETLDDGGASEALAALGALERRLSGGAARELGVALGRLRQMHETLERAETRLAVGMRRLDDSVMELRVVPVGTLFGRLPRVVRAVAQASGREVELVMEGEDVTIDRSLVELLADPLLHLTRNAVDHGIEPPEAREAAGKPRRGILRVSAARRTGQVRVRVSEDGRGIDRARVLSRAVARGLVSAEQAAAMGEEEVFALLFRPGFSTAETVTETSGRGVGLDVVQDAIRRAGGTVEVASVAGQGTSFTLRLPLTAAVQTVLLVEAAGHLYALPAARVEAVLEAGASAGCEVLELAALVGDGRGRASTHLKGGAIVIVKSGGRSFGLAVDRVQRRTDLLLRPLHPALAALPGIGGVGVLGHGEPVVVLEPDGFAPEVAIG
ncbi:MULTISPECIES: ATP-binding protein [Roseomonadaceae]|uniref:Hpt domain-containing protein n=1 Tax=Falsiroseomonas oleicola TaxID=2801474 RepID=A0ABS6HDE4_9PROT|nr:ATP-binding protein [Roseomonas oleicola]MBU8546757.1 Hpt domain-containing protein [Roseomonas oleicola]